MELLQSRLRHWKIQSENPCIEMTFVKPHLTTLFSVSLCRHLGEVARVRVVS